VGPVQKLLKLFVLARVQILLELAALALEITVLVLQLLLARLQLTAGQRRPLALELIGRGLDGIALILQILLTLRELLLKLGLRRLGRIRLPEDAIRIHITDAKGLRVRGKHEQAKQQAKPAGTR